MIRASDQTHSLSNKVDREILIANELGFEISCNGDQVLFRNRKKRLFNYLSWFFGVNTGVSLLVLGVLSYKAQMGTVKDFSFHLHFSTILSAIFVIIFAIVFHQHQSRKHLAPHIWPIHLALDLKHKCWIRYNWKILCKKTKIQFMVHTCTDPSGIDFFYRVKLQDPTLGTIIVFESNHKDKAEETAQWLQTTLQKHLT